MRTIERDELGLLATGAWIVGAGGGGNPYLACLNLRTLYDGGARVSLIDPMTLADDDAVAIVASVGAPLVGRERLSDRRFATKPLLAMQAYLKRELSAVMSVEVGGTNALLPLMDSESGEAIGTEMIRYGQRVTVIVLPPPELFLTPKGLAATGPRAFGYDFDYKTALTS